MTWDTNLTFMRPSCSFTRKVIWVESRIIKTAWLYKKIGNYEKNHVESLLWVQAVILPESALNKDCRRLVSPVIITCELTWVQKPRQDKVKNKERQQRLQLAADDLPHARSLSIDFTNLRLSFFAPRKAVFQSKLSLIIYYFLWDRLRTQQIKGAAVNRGSEEM